MGYPPAAERSDVEPPAPHNLTLFAASWAIAVLFHQAKFGHWARDPLELAANAAAVAVLCRPRSVRAFLALAILQVATVFDHLPQVPNHWLLGLVIAATIVVVAAFEWTERRGAPLDAARLYRGFAPLVRIEILLVYPFAVFAKLNTDYFSPAASCAGVHYRQLARTLSWLPDSPWIESANIGFSLAVEAAIPLLLVFRRTRTVGLLVAALFHYALGINHFFDFSGMLCALYVLFLPDDFSAKIAARLRRFRLLPEPGRLAIVWTALALVAVGAIAVDDSLIPSNRRFPLAWGVFGALWIAGFVAAMHRREPRHESTARLLRPARPVLLVFPLALVVNGLSPYLGLKTQTSFTMFSNLRTEAGRSNHWIVPAGALALWDYQTDLVTVLRSSDRELARLARAGRPIPRFTLRLLVSEAVRRGDREIELVYRREGRVVRLDRAELDPELARRPGLLARKYFWFRPIQTSPRQKCAH